MAAGVATLHNGMVSMLKYNDENSLSCIVLMTYYIAKAYYMDPILEFPSEKGFADMVYLPKMEAITQLNLGNLIMKMADGSSLLNL